jgi:hypothetical protein
VPRKLFRKYLPDGDTIRSSRWFAWLGRWLDHPNLWALNRSSVAGGFAIGLAAGLVPGPLQMVTATLLAVPLRKNLPVALLTTLYTNPFTIGPLYLLAYGYGRLLLGGSHNASQALPYQWNWSDLAGSLDGLWHWTLSLGKPLAVGLPALALTLAVLGYVAVQIGWRLWVVTTWRARVHRRRAKRREI